MRRDTPPPAGKTGHLRLASSSSELQPESEPDHAVVLWWGRGGQIIYVALFSSWRWVETRSFDNERYARDTAEDMARRLKCSLQIISLNDVVTFED